MTQTDKIDSFLDNLVICKKCDLHKTRSLVVLGRGSFDADIMLVGEAPGATEDKEGTPFKGKSGKLLDQCIEQAGLLRKNLYITNTVKCRPPENRDPTMQERLICTQYLFEEIALVQPKIIVTVGKVASTTLNSHIVSILKSRGIISEHNVHGTKRYLLPTIHPAYVLMNRSKKDLLVKDLMKAKAFTEN